MSEISGSTPHTRVHPDADPSRIDEERLLAEDRIEPEMTAPMGDPSEQQALVGEIARRAVAGNEVARVALLSLMDQSPASPGQQPAPTQLQRMTLPPQEVDDTKQKDKGQKSSSRELDARSANFIAATDMILDMGFGIDTLKILQKWDSKAEDKDFDTFFKQLEENLARIEQESQVAPKYYNVVEAKRLKSIVDELKDRRDELQAFAGASQHNVRNLAHRAFLLKSQKIETGEESAPDFEPTDEEMDKIILYLRQEATERSPVRGFFKRRLGKNKRSQSGAVTMPLPGSTYSSNEAPENTPPARAYPPRPSRQNAVPVDRARSRKARTEWGKKWQEQQEINRKGVI